MFALLASFAAAATLSLTHADTGKTFTLPPHTRVMVTLVVCGGCGYSWRLKPLNRSVIRHVSTHVVPFNHPPRVVGTGAKVIWRFRTVGAGTSPLQLAYYPPGRNTKPADQFLVTINVS